MTDAAEPTKAERKKRIHWRNGIRRIFFALSVLYFGVWAFAGYDWIKQHPFVFSEPQAPSEEPLRALGPLESRNPRVQQVLAYTEAADDGGVQYSRDLRQDLADRRLPRWLSAMIVLADRRGANEGRRVVILPDAHGDPKQFDGALTREALKSALEGEYADWRWPVRFGWEGPCLTTGYGCSRMYGEAAPFPVDLRIHCDASIGDDSYFSQQSLQNMLRGSCGELGYGLYERAIGARDASRQALGQGFMAMIGAWLAVFVFGKVFWWIIAGFAGATTSRNQPAST